MKHKLYKRRWMYGAPLLILAIILGKWLPLYLYLVIVLVKEESWLKLAHSERVDHE
jgi:hypothetical protein